MVKVNNGYKDLKEYIDLASDVETKDIVETIRERKNEIMKTAKTEGRKVKNGYFEISFAPDKTVSIAALAADEIFINEKIVKAHHNAVSVVYDYLSKNLSYCKDGGSYIKAESIEAYRIEHFRSRENDPHIHTHYVIMNEVNNSGVKRAVSRGFYDELSLDRMYNHQLNYELHKAGINSYMDNGITKIKGISDNAQIYFSKSKLKMDLLGLEYAENNIGDELTEGAAGRINALSYVMNKSDKSLTHLSDLKEVWNKEYADLAAQGEVKNAYLLKPQSKRSTDEIKHPFSGGRELEDINNVVSLAIKNVVDRHSVFTLDNVLESVRKISEDVTKTPYDMKLVEEVLSRKGLRIVDYATKNIRDSLITYPLYTTFEECKKEKDIINSINLFKKGESKIFIEEDGKGIPAKLKSFIDEYNKYFYDTFGKREYLNKGQRMALKGILSKEKFCVMIGDAGTGKTKLMNALKYISEKNGWVIDGLAHTGEASKELRYQGIAAQTVDSFLHQYKHADADVLSKVLNNEKRILIIDEASFIPNNTFLTLMEKAQAMGYEKIVVVGDYKQLTAIKSGNPFLVSIYNTGTDKLLRLSQIMRQEQNSMYAEMTKYMADINNLNIQDFIKKIEKMGIYYKTEGSTEDGERNLKDAWSVVDKFNEIRNKKGQIDTVLITKTHKDKDLLNAFVRQTLKETDELLESGLSATVYRPVDMTIVDVCSMKSYSNGMKLIFQNNTLGIERGSIGIVKRVDDELGIMDIEFYKDGVYSQRRLNRKDLLHIEDVQVYENRQLALGLGDIIMFLKNEKKLGLVNGDTGVIEAVEKDEKNGFYISVHVPGKKNTVKINLDSLYNYNFFDYGYASTIMKTQGKSINKVILYLPSDGYYNYNDLYVAFSRGREEIHIFTDDIDKLMYNLQKVYLKESILLTRLSGKKSEYLQKEADRLCGLYEVQAEEGKLKYKDLVPLIEKEIFKKIKDGDISHSFRRNFEDREMILDRLFKERVQEVAKPEVPQPKQGMQEKKRDVSEQATIDKKINLKPNFIS
ncbi:MAG: AAA family ATPase [Brevinematales bacterium]|nr:AAA family ATPase [Brevinematales bacterium]